MRIHPNIKGVRGAQSSGASIVSFNQEAFTSHEKTQGANAPISAKAAFAYTTALNSLLSRDSKQKIAIGDTTVVFWAEAPGGNEKAAAAAENLFAAILSPPPEEETTARIKDALEKVAKGRPLTETQGDAAPGTAFHVLGIVPNASRLSIRFHLRDTMGTLAQKVGAHWRDLAIEPSPWRAPPSLWHLLIETAIDRKTENIAPPLGRRARARGPHRNALPPHAPHRPGRAQSARIGTRTAGGPPP